MIVSQGRVTVEGAAVFLAKHRILGDFYSKNVGKRPNAAICVDGSPFTLFTASRFVSLGTNNQKIAWSMLAEEKGEKGANRIIETALKTFRKSKTPDLTDIVLKILENGIVGKSKFPNAVLAEGLRK